MKNEKVSILGCGWLGEALMKELSVEYITYGSKTTPGGVSALKKKFKNVFLIKLETGKITGDDVSLFFTSPVLVVSVSPGRKEEETEQLPAKISQLIKKLRVSGVKHVIFISSTSVYPFINDIVEETCVIPPEKNSGVALLKCEKLFLQEEKFITTVIRFGGLIGYDRTPGKFLAGRMNIENPDTPVNLIHRDDCIGIIKYFIRNAEESGIFNACAPSHPLKKEYYTSAALAVALPPPQFLHPEKLRWKEVSIRKLIEKTGYDFIYPDPCSIPFINEIQN